MRVNVDALFGALGIDLVKRGSSSNVRGACPVHPKAGSIGDWYLDEDTGIHHCFSGETMVATQDGPRRIDSLVGPVALLTSSGWVDSEVRCFGEQRIWEVTVRRNKVKKVIRTTGKHRWFVGGSERTTDQLLSGHRLDKALPDLVADAGKPQVDAIRHGFVYGDGTTLSTGKTTARFYGDKDCMREWFDRESGWPSWYKELPTTSDPDYLFWFMAGWFAADGCVDEHGTPSLSSASEEDITFLVDTCWRVGVVCHRPRQQLRESVEVGGYTYKNHVMYSLTFSRGSLPVEFYLRDPHAARYRGAVAERLGWVVDSVVETDSVEPVYCGVVPELHEFVLDDYILTGNCFSCGYAGDVTTLVRDIMKVSRWDALNFLVETESVDSLITEPRDYDDRRPSAEAPAAREVRESDLALFVRPSKKQLRSRNLHPDSTDVYGILWDLDEEAWVLPVRERSGKLLGWQQKSDKGVVNIPTSMRKSVTLFGIDVFPKMERAIIVESPLDCARIWTAGFDGAVATFGSEWSRDQIDLLSKHTNKVMLALDNDDAGWLSTLRFIDAFKNRLDITFFDYSAGAKDPGDMDDDEIADAIENSTRVPHVPRRVRREYEDRKKKRRARVSR